MKLSARVVWCSGRTMHQIDGEPVPQANRVEIHAAESGGCLLLRFDDRNVCISDTWHANAEDAKLQAAFEFAVGDEDWVEFSN